MKELSLLIIGLALWVSLLGGEKNNSSLKFDRSAGEKQILTMPDGTVIGYTA